MAHTSVGPTLADLMATLPQELFDQIYEETFIIEPALITIDSDYRPPKIFQGSAATRATVEAQYYNECTFEGQVQTLARWSSSLAPTQRKLVQSLLCFAMMDIDPGSARSARQINGGLKSLLPPSVEHPVFDCLWRVSREKPHWDANLDVFLGPGTKRRSVHK